MAPRLFRLVHCPLADREHEQSRRQYAHVFHRQGVVCVADAFADLPHEHQLGIALHEVGHLIAGRHASERAATRAIEDASGIPVDYVDSRYGRRLERISPRDRARAIDFLSDFFDED